MSQNYDIYFKVGAIGARFLAGTTRNDDAQERDGMSHLSFDHEPYSVSIVLVKPYYRILEHVFSHDCSANQAPPY